MSAVSTVNFRGSTKGGKEQEDNYLTSGICPETKEGGRGEGGGGFYYLTTAIVRIF